MIESRTKPVDVCQVRNLIKVHRAMTNSNLKPQFFPWGQLNGLVSNLVLTEKKAKLVNSRWKEKHLLKPGTSIYEYTTIHEQLDQFF